MVDQEFQDPSDVETISRLMDRAAGGEVRAQFDLGYAYVTGKGVGRNAVTALYWFKKAAVHNDPDAQFNVGIAYEKGDGVSRDFSEAVRWYRAAAAQGLSD